MAIKPFAAAIVGDAASAGDFIANILQASTEHSITGKSPDEAILLCIGGAWRLYGCEPDEMIGKANSSILHIPEDVEANKSREILEAALKNGKWEGTIQWLRNNSEHCFLV